MLMGFIWIPKVKQWNIDTYQLEREFVGHTGSVLCLQFDDTKVISGYVTLMNHSDFDDS